MHGQRLELKSSLGADDFSAFPFCIPDLELVREHVLAESVPFRSVLDRLDVTAEVAFGVTVRFAHHQVS